MGCAYSASVSGGTNAGFNAPSGFHVSVISWRVYYTGLGTFTAPTSRAFFGTATGVAVNSPNKYNSRSPTASGQYGNANALGAVVLVVAVTDCQHFCWIPGCRYSYISESADRGVRAETSTNGSGDVTCVGLDNWPTSTRRISKWASRARGYWWRLGNEVGLHAKTGAGAFSMIMPHFDTDVTWFSPACWANGSSQVDAWNINLFGGSIGFMVGTADINLSTGTAAITGAGALVASGSITIGTGTATLSGSGALVASGSITISTGNASLTGVGALVGSSSITINCSGVIAGTGNMSCLGTITLDAF